MSKFRLKNSKYLVLLFVTIGISTFQLNCGVSVDAAQNNYNISDTTINHSNNKYPLDFDTASAFPKLDAYLKDVFDKNIELVNTPRTTDRNLAVFQENLSLDNFSKEQQALIDDIKNQIINTSYEEILTPYYADPASAFTDFTNEAVSFYTIDLNRLADQNITYDKVQLKESLMQIQAQAEQFAIRFVQAFPTINSENFSKNKNQYLSVAAYIHRWFNVYSEKSHSNLWELMYFDGNSLFDSNTNEWTLDDLTQFSDLLSQDQKQRYPNYLTVGIVAGKQIDSQFVFLLSKSLTMYNNGNSLSYQSIIEAFLRKYESTTDYNSWFTNYFGGSIYIDNSVPEKYRVSVWDKLGNRPNLLPYYLTVNNPQNLILFSTLKYLALTDSTVDIHYEVGLASISTTVNEYWKTVLRTKEDGEENINSFQESIVYDNGDAEFSNPNNALMHSIYYPAGHLSPLDSNYTNAFCLVGKTSNKIYGDIVYSPLIKFDYLDQFTFAHEFSHALTYFRGTSNSSEYASYYFEGGYGEAAGNNFFDKSGSVGDGFANSSPERFQTKQDLIDYNVRYDQLIDVINLALAEVVLNKPVDEQTKYIGQATITPQKGANYDTVEINNLSVDSLKALNLTSYEDFVKNNLVIKQGKDSSFNDEFSLSQSQYFIYKSSTRMYNKLFGLDGWESLVKFNQARDKTESTDAGLQAAYGTSDLTTTSLIENDMKNVANKLKTKDTVIGSYSDIKKSLESNLQSVAETKKNLIKKALAETDEFKSDIFVDKPSQKAADLTVFYEDNDGNTLHDPITISGNVGDPYDLSSDEFQISIEGYTLDTLPENIIGTLSDTKQEAHFIYKKETNPNNGQIEPNNYEIGQSSITGTYIGEIVKARLTVNDVIVSQGGTFSNGTFTYYCSGKIKQGDTVIIEAFNNEGTLVDTKNIQIKSPTGKLTPADYMIGSSTITGSYQGSVKKAQLVVNGEVISAGGTFANNQFSYYIKTGSIHQGDNVFLKPIGVETSLDGVLTKVNIISENK